MNRFSDRYTNDLAELRALRSRGLGFPDILQTMRDENIRNAAEKVPVANRFGHTLISRAYMSVLTKMRPEDSVVLYYAMIGNALRRALSPDTEVVLDMGCGNGTILAELACRDLCRMFYGGDVSESGLACLAEYAASLGQSNIYPVTFDLAAPDFTFLNGRNAMVYSVAAVCFADAQTPFWERLFEATGKLSCVLLEPISYQLPELTAQPLYTLKKAQQHGFSTTLSATLKSLETAGRIRNLNIIPDFTGMTSASSYSLVQFTKV